MQKIDQVSDHYQGDKGAAYVAQKQSDTAMPKYGFEAAYFLPYIKSTDHVLDFGCGNGGIMRHLVKQAAEVAGVEVNDASRRLAEEGGFCVYSRLGDIPEDVKFDVIVSNHVLEHVPNVLDIVRELRTHLKPNGLLVVKLPIDDAQARYQRGWAKDDIDRHLFTWTPRLFANLLYETGYDVIESRVITSAIHRYFLPLRSIGLFKPACWLVAVLLRRRQLFAVARNPVS
ncbi:MAG: class I SAM-dependent methyltransferase [Pirellulales bacterium]